LEGHQIDDPAGPCPAGAELTNLALFETQQLAETPTPLFGQRFGVHQQRAWASKPSDERPSDHGLARASRGNHHPDVLTGHIGHRCLLLGGERTSELEVVLWRRRALIVDRQTAAICSYDPLSLFRQAPWDVDAIQILLIAADHPRRVPR
jgi:hypothetical protein